MADSNLAWGASPPLRSGTVQIGADLSRMPLADGVYRGPAPPRQRVRPALYQPSSNSARAIRKAIEGIDADLPALRAEMAALESQRHALDHAPFATAEAIDANDAARDHLRVDIERLEALRAQLAGRLAGADEREAAETAVIDGEAARLRDELDGLHRDIAAAYAAHAAPIVALMQRSAALAVRVDAFQRRAVTAAAQTGAPAPKIARPALHKNALVPAPNGGAALFDGRVFIPMAGVPHGMQVIEV